MPSKEVMVFVQATGLVTILARAIYYKWTATESVVPLYIAVWAVFHLSEYYVTKSYLPRTATQWLFLLFGASGAGNLFALHLASIVEYILTTKYWKFHGFPVYGAVLALIGIAIRGLAIKHCGDSFSHYIETEKPRMLVTKGVYSFCRHPSYLGFILYVMGMQLMVGNLVIYAMSMVILFRFFLVRIRLEEVVLVNNLYGEQYEKYAERVCALIPYIY